MSRSFFKCETLKKKIKWAHRFGAFPPNDQLFPSCDSQINSFPSATAAEEETVRTPLPTTGGSNGRLNMLLLHGVCRRVIHNSYSQRPLCSFSHMKSSSLMKCPAPTSCFWLKYIKQGGKLESLNLFLRTFIVSWLQKRDGLHRSRPRPSGVSPLKKTFRHVVFIKMWYKDGNGRSGAACQSQQIKQQHEFLLAASGKILYWEYEKQYSEMTLLSHT